MFHNLIDTFAWSKFPIMKRIPDLDKDVPITFIYGSTSWVERGPGPEVQKMREGSYVNVEIIQGAGHHVYGDIPEKFNELVKIAAEQADKNDKIRFGQNNNKEIKDGDKDSDDEDKQGELSKM